MYLSQTFFKRLPGFEVVGEVNVSSTQSDIETRVEKRRIPQIRLTNKRFTRKNNQLKNGEPVLKDTIMLRDIDKPPLYPLNKFFPTFVDYKYELIERHYVSPSHICTAVLLTVRVDGVPSSGWSNVIVLTMLQGN